MTKKSPRPTPKDNASKRHKPKNPKAKKGSKKSKPKKKRVPLVADPSDTAASEVRNIQPYDAVKVYLCPGCNRDIPVGMGHLVAIPPDDPDLRRHWHRGCWNNRQSRF